MASCQGPAARASMDKKTPKKNRHSESRCWGGGGDSLLLYMLCSGVSCHGSRSPPIVDCKRGKTHVYDEGRGFKGSWQGGAPKNTLPAGSKCGTNALPVRLGHNGEGTQ